MAAQDEFTARIVGRGGHGAQPQATLDPIVAASHAVLSLQTVVSRSINPFDPVVVTVGSLHAGSAPNVIPDTAELRGTMRSFGAEVRETLRRRVPEALEGAARGAGCRLEFELQKGYPALINAPVAVDRVREVAREVVGDENVFRPAPTAAAEDFAYFLRERPGAFFFLGAGNVERGITAPHHSPEFDIDETVLPRGAELMARLALHPDPID
jgi:amidohydrolase